MIVVSWDGNSTINDGVNFDSYLLPDALDLADIEVNMVERHGARPLIGGISLPSRIVTQELLVRGGDADDLRQLYDTSDGIPRTLIVSYEGGADRRYWKVLCTSFKTMESGLVYRATLQIHEDVYLRAEDESFVTWSITASPSTLVVNNPSKVNALMRVVVRPTQNKSNTNPYKDTAIIRWRSSGSAVSRPIMITVDTSGSNFDNSGDDLRLVVDGVEVDFWFTGINTSSTKIWANYDMQPAGIFTLDGAVGSADADIVVDQDISGMPATGLIEVSGELIAYASKNDQQKRFSGCTRGAGGSTAASHSDGDTVTWIQHDVKVTHGASSPTAYVPNDDYKPAFDLTSSTNESWVYAEFGESDGLRPSSWVFTNLQTSTKYTANQNTNANPWQEMGVRSDSSQSIGKQVSGYWSIYDPVGITGANFSNGQKYSTSPSRWLAYIYSSINGASLTAEYAIPAPSSSSSWQSWSQNLSSLTSGSKYVYMWLLGQARSSTSHRVEVADVTLTLDSTQTPTVTMVTEAGNYSLNLTLTNETSGTAVKLAYQMALNDQLEMDTEARTVTDLTDNSNQFQAMTLLGGSRVEWWSLVPGDNTLKAEDTGMVGVTITIYFRKRYRS